MRIKPLMMLFGLLPLAVGYTFAQSLDSALAFVPITVGNRWQFAQYMETIYPGNLLGYYTVTVTGDTIMSNGKLYRFLRQEPATSNSTNFVQPTYLRMDSTTANVYEAFVQGTSGELIWDSLRAQPGGGTHWSAGVTYRQDTILGVTALTRRFFPDVFGNGCVLAYRMGPVYFSVYGEDEFSRLSVLVYARIDGRDYGTLVSVNSAAHTTPKYFELLQNYPNPFNPTTTIRYALPSRAYVTLTVFNMLGQQIAIVVNESEEAGDHDVRFDGSGLASGVYFYRLMAGDYLATKKLLVIR